MAENQDINIKINIDTGAANATVKAVKESLGDISKVSKEINKQREDEIKTINNVATANANALKGVEKKLDTELKGLKGMRIEYKELLKQLDAAAAAGDTISFKKIEAELGALRNDISDTAKRMKMLDPGEILGGWVKFGQGVVGAYSAITAAADLFGAENEQLQEIERKSMQLIQLMMGLEQARQILIDGGGRAQLKALVETTVAQYKKIAAYITEALTIKTVEASSKSATTAQLLWNKTVAANPMLLLAAGVLAVAAAVAILVIRYNDQEKAMDKVRQNADLTVGSIKAEQFAMNKLFDELKKTNVGSQKRADLIKEINTQYGEYLPSLLTEKTSLEDIDTAQKKANDSLKANIFMKAKRQDLEKVESKLADLYSKQRKETELIKSLEEGVKTTPVGQGQSAASKNLMDAQDALDDINLKIEEQSKLWDEISTYYDSQVPDQIELTNEQKAAQDAYNKSIEITNNAKKKTSGETVDKPKEGDKSKIGGIWMTYTNGEWKADYEIEAIDIIDDGVISDVEEKLAEILAKQLAAQEEYVKSRSELEEIVFSNNETYQNIMLSAREKYGLDEIEVLKKTYDEELKLLNEYAIKYQWTQEEILKATDKLKEEYKSKIDPFSTILGKSLGLDDDTASLLSQKILDVGAEAINSIMSIRKSNIDEQFSKENDSLERRYQNEIKLAGDNEIAKENIDKRYDSYRNALEKKQAKEKQKFAVTQALINGALGITQIFATTPPPASYILAAANVATTALQIGVIKSQKFAKGGILRGPSHANGGIMAGNVELEGNEGVINKRSMSNPALANIASAVNVAGGGVPLTNNTSPLIDYDLLAMKLGTIINDKQVYVVESDITKTQNRVKVIENKNKF